MFGGVSGKPPAPAAGPVPAAPMNPEHGLMQRRPLSFRRNPGTGRRALTICAGANLYLQLRVVRPGRVSSAASGPQSPVPSKLRVLPPAASSKLFSPIAQRFQNRTERLAFLGQKIFETRGMVLVKPGANHPLPFKRL